MKQMNKWEGGKKKKERETERERDGNKPQEIFKDRDKLRVDGGRWVGG